MAIRNLGLLRQMPFAALLLLFFVLVRTDLGEGSARALAEVDAAGGARAPLEDWTALHSAASAGNVELVQLLLAANEQAVVVDAQLRTSSFLMARDANGVTALHFAASKGHTEVVRVLLGAGAPLEHWDNNGWAALHHAAFNGHAEAVRMLLAAHAQLPPSNIHKMRDVLLDKAADWAAEKGFAEVLHVLVAAGAQMRPDWAELHSAAAAGDVQLVRSLLAAHGHVLMRGEMGLFPYAEAVDANGTSALHIAASKGHTEVVCLLIPAGAHHSIGDSNGWTALHHAAFYGHAEALRVMLAFGASLENILDNVSRTVLHLAAGKDRVEAVHVLLAAGAQLEAVDDLGMTALHASAFEGSAGAVRVLLAAGAQLEAVDTYGLTALHYAVTNAHVEVVHALLSANAQLPAVGVLGMVALHAAAVLGRIDRGALALFSRRFLPSNFSPTVEFMGILVPYDVASWGLEALFTFVQLRNLLAGRKLYLAIAYWALGFLGGFVCLLVMDSLPGISVFLFVFLQLVAREAACRVVIFLLRWLRWLPDAAIPRPQQHLPVTPQEARPA